jgi:hypothetical protein
MIKSLNTAAGTTLKLHVVGATIILMMVCSSACTAAEAQKPTVAQRIFAIARTACNRSTPESAGYDDQVGGRCPLRKYSIVYGSESRLCRNVEIILNEAPAGRGGLYSDPAFLRWMPLDQDFVGGNVGLNAYVVADLFNDGTKWAVLLDASHTGNYPFSYHYTLRRVRQDLSEGNWRTQAALEHDTALLDQFPQYGPEQNIFVNRVIFVSVKVGNQFLYFPNINKNMYLKDPWIDPLSRNTQSEIHIFIYDGRTYVLGRSPLTEIIYVVGFSPNKKGEDLCYFSASEL